MQRREEGGVPRLQFYGQFLKFKVKISSKASLHHARGSNIFCFSSNNAAHFFNENQHEKRTVRSLAVKKKKQCAKFPAQVQNVGIKKFSSLKMKNKTTTGKKLKTTVKKKLRIRVIRTVILSKTTRQQDHLPEWYTSLNLSRAMT
jgi:hypothetical protein